MTRLQVRQILSKRRSSFSTTRSADGGSHKHWSDCFAVVTIPLGHLHRGEGVDTDFAVKITDGFGDRAEEHDLWDEPFRLHRFRLRCRSAHVTDLSNSRSQIEPLFVHPNSDVGLFKGELPVPSS